MRGTLEAEQQESHERVFQFRHVVREAPSQSPSSLLFAHLNNRQPD
jgi:hypothetical protein